MQLPCSSTTFKAGSWCKITPKFADVYIFIICRLLLLRTSVVAVCWPEACFLWLVALDGPLGIPSFTVCKKNSKSRCYLKVLTSWCMKCLVLQRLAAPEWFPKGKSCKGEVMMSDKLHSCKLSILDLDGSTTCTENIKCNAFVHTAVCMLICEGVQRANSVITIVVWQLLS